MYSTVCANASSASEPTAALGSTVLTMGAVRERQQVWEVPSVSDLNLRSRWHHRMVA